MTAVKKILESPLTLLLLVVASYCHPLGATDVAEAAPRFGMAGLWFPSLLLGLGIALILLEVFVLPGFGIAGISGILLTCAGLFLGIHTLVVEHGDFSDFMGYSISAGGTVIGATLLGLMFFWLMPRLPGLRAMLPKDARPGELRGVALDPLHHLTGQPGIAKTALRPAGKVALENGQLVDVVTKGEFIDAGAHVYIVKIEGPSVVVSKLA